MLGVEELLDFGLEFEFSVVVDIGRREFLGFGELLIEAFFLPEGGGGLDGFFEVLDVLEVSLPGLLFLKVFGF